jgi:hypothetical protein
MKEYWIGRMEVFDEWNKYLYNAKLVVSDKELNFLDILERPKSRGRDYPRLKGRMRGRRGETMYPIIAAYDYFVRLSICLMEEGKVIARPKKKGVLL